MAKSLSWTLPCTFCAFLSRLLQQGLLLGCDKDCYLHLKIWPLYGVVCASIATAKDSFALFYPSKNIVFFYIQWWIPQWRSLNPKTILWNNLVAVLHGGTSTTVRILLEKVKNACAMLRNVLRSVREAQVSYSEISCLHRGSKNHKADITRRVFRKPNHWEAFPKGEPSSRERWFLHAWETDFWH